MLEFPDISSGYAFCRNPLRVCNDAPASDSSILQYNVKVGGVAVFAGHFLPPLNTDLSDVAEGCISYYPEADETSGKEWIQVLSKTDMENRYCMSVETATGDDGKDANASTKVILVPGGVSRRNWRRLRALGHDPFSHRFLNPAANFFLSARTGSWRFTLKETELAPLYFIMAEQGKVRIQELLTGKDYVDTLSAGVWALSIGNLRKKIWDADNRLPSAFDVYRLDSENNWVYACNIGVQSAPANRDRTLVKFRNSLGVFDFIDLPGVLKKSQISDNGDSQNSIFDESINGFVSHRGRIPLKIEFSIETTPLSAAVIKCLADMVVSDEVYLIKDQALPVKVIPSIENFSYVIRADSPQPLSLKFEAVDEYANITPDITTGTECSRRGVFSDEFSDEFY